MSSAADFKGGYSPGGRTKRARARDNGRRGGYASGVQRRQLAKGKRPAPRVRARDEALCLAYEHRQLTRERFDRLYERHFPRPDRGTAEVGWEKGRDTLWEHYRGLFTLYRACGQHTRTTNGQRGAALASRDRPRCRRTIQRLNRRLAELGLAVLSHFKDQRNRPGRKDCLVVEIRTPSILHVTPPLRGRENRPKGTEVLSLPAPQTASAPPPSVAESEGPAPPAQDDNYEEGESWEAAFARFRTRTAESRPSWDQPPDPTLSSPARLALARQRLADVEAARAAAGQEPE